MNEDEDKLEVKSSQYVTSEEVIRRQNTSLERFNTDDEVIISELNKRLMELSLVVDEYCNTKFIPTDDNFFVDFSEKFKVRRTPLLNVNDINIGNYKLIENINFFSYLEQNRIELKYELPQGIYFKKAVRVFYKFGFLEIPQTVKDVIVELLALEEGFNSSAGHPAIQSENWDNEYSYQSHSGKDNTLAELRKNILARLNPYIQPKYIEPKRDGNIRVMVI